MTASDDLAAAEEAKRSSRERRTAITAAVRDFTRTGSGRPPAGLLARLAERRDGTPATLRDTTTRTTTGGTNQADHITHASTPLETNREDH